MIKTVYVQTPDTHQYMTDLISKMWYIILKNNTHVDMHFPTSTTPTKKNPLVHHYDICLKLQSTCL